MLQTCSCFPSAKGGDNKINGIPNIIGKRIELIYTDNPYTKLKPGDRGTVTDVTEIPFKDTPLQIWINWDSGSKLALLSGMDKFKILESENE
jgi:hypothetical protein